VVIGFLMFYDAIKSLIFDINVVYPVSNIYFFDNASSKTKAKLRSTHKARFITNVTQQTTDKSI